MTNMPANFIDCQQGTEMWKELRCGNATASRTADIIATKKQTKKQIETGVLEELADRAHYRTEIICERLTGQPYPQYVTKEMEWGRQQERYARAAYELATGVLVETVGFVLHPTIPRFGCSPDGLVGDDGMVELKCPTTKTHLEWLQAGIVPLEHVPQMLSEMSCTGRAWCDFMSFDPRLPDHLQRFIRRYERNDKLIAAIEAEVVHFNAEIDQILAALPQKPQGIVIAMDRIADDEV